MITILGIIRRRLRDEILCQICKQLNDHPSQREKKSRNQDKAEQRERSFMRGWFLLCICLYTFPPGSNDCFSFEKLVKMKNNSNIFSILVSSFSSKFYSQWS